MLQYFLQIFCQHYPLYGHKEFITMYYLFIQIVMWGLTDLAKTQIEMGVQMSSFEANNTITHLCSNYQLDMSGTYSQC